MSFCLITDTKVAHLAQQQALSSSMSLLLKRHLTQGDASASELVLLTNLCSTLDIRNVIVNASQTLLYDVQEIADRTLGLLQNAPPAFAKWQAVLPQAKAIMAASNALLSTPSAWQGRQNACRNFWNNAKDIQKEMRDMQLDVENMDQTAKEARQQLDVLLSDITREGQELSAICQDGIGQANALSQDAKQADFDLQEIRINIENSASSLREFSHKTASTAEDHAHDCQQAAILKQQALNAIEDGISHIYTFEREIDKVEKKIEEAEREYAKMPDGIKSLLCNVKEIVLRARLSLSSELQKTKKAFDRSWEFFKRNSALFFKQLQAKLLSFCHKVKEVWHLVSRFFGWTTKIGWVVASILLVVILIRK